MADLGRKMYVKGQSWLNRLEKDEEGSTAVEFMGIAAVVIVVIMLIKTYMDTNGQDQVDSIFDVLFEGLLSWFSF